MKILTKYVYLPGIFILIPLLNGCVIIADPAGLKAKEADYLSAEGEQRITDRVKKEIMLEWNDFESTDPCIQQNN
jgi:hypothetical protein